MPTPSLRLPRLSGLGLLLSALLGLTLPSALHAQADPDSVKLRNDCRLAAQVLSTGQPAPHFEDALTTIARCGSEAVSPLLSMWTAAPSDRDELLPLIMATRRVAAPPIADRLFDLMGEPSAPLDVRLAAIMVTVTWADPHAWPTFDDLRSRGPDSMKLRGWVTDHGAPMSGRESLEPGFVDRLRSALEAIAASDPSEEMVAAAAIALRNPPLW